jgi:hypothetical protein
VEKKTPEILGNIPCVTGFPYRRNARPTVALEGVVALIRDMPEAGLIRGQVGTIVEVLGPEVFEVELSDDSSRTYASLALGSNDLLRLHHEPLHEAA